jgi:CRISPR-associated protein Csd1
VIIQALVRRYEDALINEIPYGWQNRPADYAVHINDEGEVQEITDLAESEGKKKKPRIFLLPEEANRTSNIKATFICDNGGYIFGSDKKNGQKKFAESGALHRAVLGGINTKTANAIMNFFNRTHCDNDIPKKGYFLFMHNGRFVNDCSEIQVAWNKYNHANKKGLIKRDLISGNETMMAEFQRKIKLSGVDNGGTSLVNVNKEAFTSYGNKATDPAAFIGENTAFSYATALNELLSSDKHHKQIGSDTLVYWAAGKDEAESELFSMTLQPSESDTDKLDGIMKNMAAGKMVDVNGCNFSKPFYLLVLSPNASRISVRLFVVKAFGDIMKNITRHYENLEIVRPKYDTTSYPTPWELLIETTVDNRDKKVEQLPCDNLMSSSETTIDDKSKKVAPLLCGELMRSIVGGAKYPMSLYNAMLIRIRAGNKINRVKAAIIKAVLIRNYSATDKESEVATVSLNPDSNYPPYVLGRLFSVLEQLQQKAAGTKLNTTIRDKYFASASTNPGSVFPTLLKLSMAHSAKLDNANSVYFEKLKTELLGKLDADSPFPSVLGLDDQGRFIMGYYHQTQDFYIPKKDNNDQEEALGDKTEETL